MLHLALEDHQYVCVSAPEIFVGIPDGSCKSEMKNSKDMLDPGGSSNQVFD